MSAGEDGIMDRAAPGRGASRRRAPQKPGARRKPAHQEPSRDRQEPMSTSVQPVRKRAAARPPDVDGAARKKILIADDDDAIRQLLVDVLQGEGYETFEAKRGGEVLRT